MSCLESSCSRCHWHELSNELYRACPRCGEKYISVLFDEYPEEETAWDNDDWPDIGDDDD